MDVEVDQPRHQRAPAAVDDDGPGRIDRPLRDARDQIALDQHAHPAREAVGLGVEDVYVREQGLGRRLGGGPGGDRNGAEAQHERGSKPGHRVGHRE